MYCHIHYRLVALQRPDSNDSNDKNSNNVNNELCHLYPYPCPKKFYKLPAVLFCYANLFYKLAWAWAWV